MANPNDPWLVLIADVNSGFGDAGHPRPPYIEAGINCLSPNFSGAPYDTLGFGGHGDTIPMLYNDVLRTISNGGIPAHVVPLVACSAQGYATAAIGRAYAWVANEQQRMRSQGQRVQWVVTLPSEPGIAGPSESAGRKRLDQVGVPLIQAAGNNRLDLDQRPTSNMVYRSTTTIIAGCTDSYSGFGRGVVKASSPAGYGTSGATAIAAAWVTLVRQQQPSWPIAWVVAQVNGMASLPGLSKAVAHAAGAAPAGAPFQPRRVG